MTRPTTPLLRANTDPHRVAPQVPLALLPGQNYPIGPWNVASPVRLQAQATLAVLDQLVAAAEQPDRRALDAALPAAVTSLGALAAALARHEPILPASQAPPGKLIHRYFGVRHSNHMSSGSAALYAVCVFRWCLADLAYAALDANDVLAELLACRAVITDIAHAPRWYEPVEEHTPDDELTYLLGYLPDGNPWDRWVVAHHGYLLCNLLAADGIRWALQNTVNRRMYAGAVTHLRRATTQVHGLTATMIHSAVLPGRLYVDEIRPSMAPPHLPKPLTGAMFTEHRLYYRRIRELLAALGGEPYATLVRRQPDLAAARSDLLYADLMDITRHITMGELLLRGEDALGGDRSLVQQTGSKDSAIAELGRMRNALLGRYRPFLQHGAAAA